MSGFNFDSIWASLSLPASGLSAHLHSASGLVWLAVDSSGRRHLLVDAAEAEVGRSLISTHGLRAETVEISVEDGPVRVWADIVCADASLNQTFLAVAEDLVADAASARTPLEAVERTLRKWRWFWAVETSALSESAALGLFGEMWFLDRWAPLPGAISAWVGPSGVRHDFSGPLVSVEVKASSSHGTEAVRHRISTLDQLDDPENGVLYLFSLQVIAEPSAGNTLASVVGRVRGRLGERPDLLDALDRNLSLAGWSPAAADQVDTTYRVAAERLYSVVGGFPRLTRATFPGGLQPGVDDVSYSVDLAVCSEWLVATTPDQAVHLLQGMV